MNEGTNAPYEIRQDGTCACLRPDSHVVDQRLTQVREGNEEWAYSSSMDVEEVQVVERSVFIQYSEMPQGCAFRESL